MTLVEEAIAAHGGLDRWRELESIRVELDCGGLALRMKGHAGTLRRVTAVVDTRRPRVDFHRLGVFDGEVPRPPGMARRLRWSTAELVHFAGYALWNYMTVPFIFAERDLRLEELPGRRLRATFPPEIPTHSREQVFHIRRDGLIARLDYTAEVFGPWARAAHHCLAYREFGGIVVPVRRRVVPRGLSGPTLVSIEIAGVEPVIGQFTHPEGHLVGVVESMAYRSACGRPMTGPGR